MLPIFRVIPAGGVLLAIAILLLALNPPRDMTPSVRVDLAPASGPLINRADHPEWPQFMALGAARRAGEVALLRELPDSVMHRPPATPSVKPPSQDDAPEAAEAAPATTGPDIGAPKLTDAQPADVKLAETAPQTAGPTPEAAKAENANAPAASQVAGAQLNEAQIGDAQVKTADAVPHAAASQAPGVEPQSDKSTLADKAAAAPATQPEAESDHVPGVADSSAKTVIDQPKKVEVKAAETKSAASTAQTEPQASAPEIAKPAPSEAKPAADPRLTTAELKPAAADSNQAAAEKTAAPEPKLTEAVAAPVEPQAAAPQPAAQSPVVANEKPAADAATPTAQTPKLADAKPVASAPVSAAVATTTAKIVASVPLPPVMARPSAKPETNGSRVNSHAPKTAAPGPVELAALPAQPVQPDDDLVTGSIEAPSDDPTIPVGIGEASSTELPVVMPRERPPVLRRLDRRRAHQSKRRPRQSAHHAARPSKTAALPPPPFNIFDMMFKNAAAGAKPAPGQPDTRQAGERRAWINQ